MSGDRRRHGVEVARVEKFYAIAKLRGTVAGRSQAASLTG
jgi:hypothetical protein